MKYNILSTGSKGNAVIVEDRILIDCGVPFKTIEPFIYDFSLVLLTHIHSDHFNRTTLRRLSEERPLIRFAACEWLVKPLVDAGVNERQIDVMQPNFRYAYGNGVLMVSPFALSHDVPNCGWRIRTPGGWAIYATDTGNLNGIEAKDYDLYLIESNYTEEDIKKRIDEKKVNGEFAYEFRVLKTHLSTEQCDDWIARNVGSNGVYVRMHSHIEVSDDDREIEGAS